MSNPFAFGASAPAPVATPAPPAPVAAPAFVAPPAPPAPAPQPAAFDGDPFAGPAPQAERPRIRDLHGRLLLIRPILVEKVQQQNEDGTTRIADRMTADVIVLDGGPLQYGGAPEKLGGRPHDKTAQVPYRIESMFISSVGLVSQSRDALAKRLRGEPGMVLGRLTTGVAKSDKHNPPYLLADFTADEAAIARSYLSTVDPFA